MLRSEAFNKKSPKLSTFSFAIESYTDLKESYTDLKNMTALTPDIC